MARTKQYRLWDDANKKMIYPPGLVGDGSAAREHAINMEGTSVEYNLYGFGKSEVHNHDVYDWTGTYDCEKKKLYEEDIIEYDSERYIIRWDDAELAYWAEGVGETESIALHEVARSSHLIGNTLENEDLTVIPPTPDPIELTEPERDWLTDDNDKWAMTFGASTLDTRGIPKFWSECTTDDKARLKDHFKRFNNME